MRDFDKRKQRREEKMLLKRAWLPQHKEAAANAEKRLRVG
jgi:hypothetical protein